MSDDDVSDTELSPETFLALNEWKQDQEKLSEQENNPFTEDWKLSQFWYSSETVEVLASEILRVCGENGSVALISAPTLYKCIKNSSDKIKLFEYDKRFECFGDDFIYYDYNDPLALPGSLKNSFDLVFADPPYLSKSCLINTAVTIKYLSKEKIILCTGSIMGPMAEQILKVHRTEFLPKHEKNLSNDFACFTNYQDKLKN